MRKIESSGNTERATRLRFARRGEIATERLFDDDARAFGQAGGAEPLDDRGEERGRDGEVVRRTRGRRPAPA